MMAEDMIKRALQRWRGLYQELQTWQQHTGQQKVSQVSTYDSENGELIGSSRHISSDIWIDELQSALKHAIECNIEDDTQKQLWLDNFSRVDVLTFNEALLPGGFYSSSTAYSRSRSWDGTYVAILYAQGDEVKPWVGRVNWYLQLSLPSDVAEAGVDYSVVQLCSMWHCVT